MAGIRNAPLPSNLILLSDLPSFSTGDKARFLGCVTKYSIKTATLTLEHNYPPGNAIKAEVDVNLVLSSLSASQTRIGEWVNVIGYVHGENTAWSTNAARTPRCVNVQALLLWSSGPLKIAGYEKSLDGKNLMLD